MTQIIIEGVLFVAFIAAVAALVYMVILYFTPVGVRLRQARNRRQIERAEMLVCPIHGPREQTELVRLTSGAVMCPECYKETIHG